ncbi:MAG: radical SAM protein [Pyrinomonadaceae bacterium]|nr:radical SAM protein [Pyrinomonadaceae bacterium]MCX7640504.1 radical SAM protein [Pyrinomonadaceae bacterium]MDW8303915.1 radical SAM protein [Acidobacteriota bacterium]
MDFATKEILKRYAKMMVGKPITPIFLNILVTSVCDMRCTHCFFTEELNDRERKKFQMKTEEIIRISETLGGNLGVLVIAGGEPFTRKDLPDIVRAFYENNHLESVYLMTNGQIHQRIFPDVTKILEECPNLNVAVAIGIDGLKEAHEKIRRKPGSWDKAIQTARTLQQMKREQYPQLDIQTCTCVMRSNQDTIFEWYDFLKNELKPDKVNINYIRPPSADPSELEFDHEIYAKLSKMILEDTRNAVIKNSYVGKAGFFKAAVDIYMHEIIAKTKEENLPQLRCYAGSAGAVIYDNGALSSCENKPDVLNLRDFDWNFQAAWQSELMRNRRKEVANGCFCTHESNCYYPSLPFNMKHLVQIKRLEKQMKKAAKKLERNLITQTIEA